MRRSAGFARRWKGHKRASTDRWCVSRPYTDDTYMQILWPVKKHVLGALDTIQVPVNAVQQKAVQQPTG
eukprot:2969956-Pyramimonas_sp.AAC.1